MAFGGACFLAMAYGCGDGGPVDGGEDGGGGDGVGGDSDILTQLVFTADSVELRSLGEPAVLSIEGTTASGATATNIKATWSVDDAGIASVSPTGTVTAVANGTTTVRATSDGLEATAKVTVRQVVASIALAAEDSVFVGFGDLEQLGASLFDARRNPIIDRPVQWSVDDTTVASIDTTGLATSVNAGTVQVRAGAETASAFVELTVVPITGVGHPDVDLLFAQVLRRWNFPGVSVAASKNGRLVLARGFGFADSAANEFAHPDHLWRVASVSKPITSVGVMKAIEDGLVTPEDLVFVDHLGALLPAGGPADSRVLDITVNDLLQHTAGWDRSVVADPTHQLRTVASDMNVSSPPDRSTFISWLVQQPLQFAPGDRFAYHNVTYMTLAQLLATASGMSYQEYFQSQVFGPLGITRATVGSSRQSDRADGEVVYYESVTGPSVYDSGPSIVPSPYGGDGGARETSDGSGGWVISMPDLVRLGVAVDGDASAPDLISATTQSFMWTDPGNDGYSAGFFFSASPFAWFHSGGFRGTSSFFAIYPDDGVIIAWSFNTTPPPPNVGFGVDFSAMARVIREVSDWPADRDLFSEF